MLGDLRLAFRSLRRAPGFTALAVVVLALGIGANTALFSIVDAVLLRPLPFPEPDRLMALWERNLSGDELRNSASPANALAWRDEAGSFSAIGAWWDGPASLSEAGAEPAPVRLRVATPSLLAALRVRPAAGRLLVEADERPGAAPVALIDHRLWIERFGGRRDVLGRTVRIDAEPHEIVGILPPTARLPASDADVWVPLEVDEETRAWPGRFLRVIGRLASGADEAAADAELAAIAARRAETVPELNANWTAHAVPLREDAVGEVRPALLVLLAAVAFLLLVACANVANLLIARAAARADELAVRAALGASRARLSRQLLAESLALGLLAGAVGLLAGAWLADVLPRAVPPDLAVPRLDEVGLDPRVLAFTAAVTLLTVVLFGWLPGLLATRGRITASGDRAVGGRATARVRAGLVVGQLAVVLVLLAGAGLMARSLAGLARVDLGFDPSRVLVADVALPDAGYPEDPPRVAFFTTLVERVSALPGVRSAAAISFLPLSGERSATGLLVEGRPRPPPGRGPVADVRAVTPAYLETMRIPLRAGRDVLPSDAARRPPVAVVGERLARTLFPGENPIGRRIAYEWDEDVWVEIVGVAADVRHGGPAEDPYLEVYLPVAQFPYARMSVVLRADGDPASLAPAVRREVRLLDPDLPVARMRTLEVLAGDALGKSRLSALLLAGFGGLGLLLAAVGVYGVAAHGVTTRTRELGVRAALGAAPREMVLLVLREGAVLALAGVAVGLVGAAGLTRALAGLLYGVAPGDPATLLAAAFALGATAVAASLPPAVRAARLDPVRALRTTAS